MQLKDLPERVNERFDARHNNYLLAGKRRQAFIAIEKAQWMIMFADSPDVEKFATFEALREGHPGLPADGWQEVPRTD